MYKLKSWGKLSPCLGLRPNRYASKCEETHFLPLLETLPATTTHPAQCAFTLDEALAQVRTDKKYHIEFSTLCFDPSIENSTEHIERHPSTSKKHIVGFSILGTKKKSQPCQPGFTFIITLGCHGNATMVAWSIICMADSATNQTPTPYSLFQRYLMKV